MGKKRQKVLRRLAGLVLCTALVLESALPYAVAGDTQATAVNPTEVTEEQTAGQTADTGETAGTEQQTGEKQTADTTEPEKNTAEKQTAATPEKAEQKQTGAPENTEQKQTAGTGEKTEEKKTADTTEKTGNEQNGGDVYKLDAKKNIRYTLAEVKALEKELWNTMKLDFVFKDLEEGQTVKAGEKFEFSLPEKYLCAEDTKELAAIYAGAKKDLGDKDAVFGKEEIAEYTVKDNLVKVTFKKGVENIADQAEVFGRIVLDVRYERASLTEEEQKITWEIQTLENNKKEELKLTLPKRESIQWSDRAEDFKWEIKEGEEPKLAFAFLRENEDIPVLKGDTAVFELKDTGYTAEDTEEAVPVQMEKEDDEDGTVQIASYIVEDGTVTLTFEEGVQEAGNQAGLAGEIAVQEEKEPEEDGKAEEENDMANAKEVLADEEEDEYIIVGGVKVRTTGIDYELDQKHVYWIDNNNALKKRPNVGKFKTDIYNYITVAFTYKVNDVEKTVYLKLSDLKEYGLEVGEDNIDMVSYVGTGHYGVTLNLPEIEVEIPGQPGEEGEEPAEPTWTEAKWSLPEQTEWTQSNGKNAPYTEDYWMTDVTKDNIGNWPSAGKNDGWYFVEAIDYQAQVEVRRGEDRMWGVYDTVGELYHFYAQTGTETGSTSVKLDSPEILETEWGEGNTAAIPGSNTFTVKHLPKYNLNATEIQYYIDRPENEGGKSPDRIDSVMGYENGTGEEKEWLGEDEYLQESVENSLSSNHHADTEKVYNGGKLIFTRTGATTYEATKVWADKADPSARPEVTFELWRFSRRDETGEDLAILYQSATPVKGPDGKTATVTIEARSRDDSQEIDFSEVFEGDKTDNGNYLPKFDQEGYPYTYIVREKMTGEGASKYETAYGSLNEDGSVEDILPDGVEERDDSDTSIYHEGTVRNVLKGNTTTTATKTWNAAAFQSELSDVTVTLKLQERPVGSTDEDAWTDSGETVKLKDFYAETLTQSISKSTDKYDGWGNEVEYRWIESGVYQGDSEESLLQEDGSFTLRQNDMDVTYSSEIKVETQKTADGKITGYETTITNQLEDKEDYIVEKDWDEELTPQPIELLVYRMDYKTSQVKLVTKDGELFQLDGTLDTEETLLYAEGDLENPVGSVTETAEWKAVFTGFNKYDEQGRPYEYLTLEGTKGAWDTQYTYEEEELNGETVQKVVIHNVPGAGGYEVRVRKRWMDGGDVAHREPVTFSFYKRTEEGKFEPVTGIGDDGTGTLKVDESTGWWREIWISNDLVNEDDLLVLETKIGSREIGAGAADDGSFGATLGEYTPDYMEQVYQIQHGGQSDAGETSDYLLLRGENHYYNARYSMNYVENDVDFYVVSNIRLGRIDATATKQWVDGNDQKKRQELLEAVRKALDNDGYEIGVQLVLDSSSDEDRIDYAKGTVTVGGTTMAIQDADGNTTGKAVYRLDLTKSEQTFDFYNLPKYNQYGEIVHYEMKEVAYIPGQRPEENKTYTLTELKSKYPDAFKDIEYSFSMEMKYDSASGGDTSAHSVDKQTYTVKNRLGGTKEVNFGKLWKDGYRYERGERPDIYFDVYRTEHYVDEDGNVQEKLVSIYKDVQWTFFEGADNLMQVTLESETKYDSLGYEIIYYAQEKMRVNKEMFDYTDVAYMHCEEAFTGNPVFDEENGPYEEIGTEKGWYEGKETDEIRAALKENPEEKGTYLLRENGIFVNRIAANVQLEGKKVWANLPDGYPREHLPEVAFFLYQYGDGEVIPDDETVNIPGDRNAFATIRVADWGAQLVKGEYHFAFGYEGTNRNTVVDDTLQVAPEDENSSKIPKYDEDGNLYTYIMREKLVNFGNESGNSAGASPAQGYPGLVFSQPVINNYVIRNPYKPQLGEISVRKWLDTKAYEQLRGETEGSIVTPTIDFELRRSFYSNGELVDDGVFYEDQSITSENFVKQSEGNYKADIKFSNLPVYAPNGNRYYYTVTEKILVEENHEIVDSKAYTSKAGIGELGFDAGSYADGKEVANLEPKPAGTRTVLHKAADTLGGIWSKAFKLETGTARDTADKSWATFKNIYVPDKAPLVVEKQWTDGHNVPGFRPKELTFQIARRAGEQPEGSAIEEQTLGTVKVTIPDTAWEKTAQDEELVLSYPDTQNDKWTETMKKGLSAKLTSVGMVSGNTGASGTSDTWTIAFEGFDLYAPNGMLWQYKVTEIDVPNPYVCTANSSWHSYDGSQFTGGVIKNTMMTNAGMTKKFADENNLKAISNLTGYDLTLNASLYVAAYKVNDDAAFDKDGFLAAMEGTSPTVEWKKINDSSYRETIAKIAGEDFTTSRETLNGNAIPDITVKVENLPSAIKDADGNNVYLRYAYLEDSLVLKDEGTPVYKETFTPGFYVNGDSALYYYFETNGEILNSINKWDDVPKDSLLFKPYYMSEQQLTSYIMSGDWPVDKPVIEVESNKVINQTLTNTMYNTFPLKKLTFTKNWENDEDNLYGTRLGNGTDKWQLEFKVLRKDSDGQDSFEVMESVKTQSIANKPNTADTGIQTVSNLPEMTLEKNGNGYKITRWQYAARELDADTNKTLINKKANKITEEADGDRAYNSTYNVSYEKDEENTGTAGDTDTSEVTNTMQTIELYAEKDWGTYQDIPGKKVTLELQYLLGDRITWKSFDTPAKVTLDGTPETNGSGYFETEAWKAVWENVPLNMPDSETKEVTGDDGNKRNQTIYRVVEYSEDAYATSTGLTGSGTAVDPYVFSNCATGLNDKETEAFTNALTELKVEKKLDSYGKPLENKDFTFTFESGETGDTKAYQWQKFSAGESLGSGTVKTGGTFTLKGGEHILIYGLKKGVTYTVTESEGKTWFTTVEVKDGSGQSTSAAEGKSGTVTIAQTKPAETPTIIFTNDAAGKITIEKKDEDNQPLNGVTFELWGKKTNDLDVEYSKVGTDTTEAGGKVVFEKLRLDMDYQIRETKTADGQNILAEPIDITLPFGTETESQGKETGYLGQVKVDGKHYYAEVTIEITNNSIFTMPTTAGRNIFWPGVIGFVIAVFFVGGYIWHEEKKRKSR